MPEARARRIGVDARELGGAPTGVGRYLSELLTRWLARPDARERRFVLYVPSRGFEAGALAPFAAAEDLEVRTVPGSPGTRWEQIALPSAAARDRLDVFFAPAYSGPLRLAAPLVLVVHDLSYYAHPEWFAWPGGLRRRTLTRWAARKAACVLTVSAFSAAEIARYLDVPRTNVQVVYHGPPALEPAGRAGAPGPPREPLVLFVGSIFNRRHLPDLVRAFARVAGRRPEARLVVAGENRTMPREDPGAVARELGIGDRVDVRSYVTDADLAGLYATASAFAFFSEYEGFGLTPLEALAHGVPVVVYDTPVAREVYGPAASYVAPGDMEAASNALERLLADPAARSAALAPAAGVLSRYSWDRAAEQTLAAIEQAAGGAHA